MLLHEHGMSTPQALEWKMFEVLSPCLKETLRGQFSNSKSQLHLSITQLLLSDEFKVKFIKPQILRLHGIAISYAFIIYLIHNEESDEDSNMIVLCRVQMFLCITLICLKSAALSLWCSLSPQNQRKCLQNVDGRGQR